MRSARTHCGERVAARGCRCAARVRHRRGGGRGRAERRGGDRNAAGNAVRSRLRLPARSLSLPGFFGALPDAEIEEGAARPRRLPPPFRSEENTSELQSLMRISYAVFCLKKKTQPTRR